MIEISSQMREFVNFAQDAVANNAKNTVARLGKKESTFATIPIGAATDGDSVGKLRRSDSSKRANNTVRTEFRKTVAAAAEMKRSDSAIRFSPNGFIEA